MLVAQHAATPDAEGKARSRRRSRTSDAELDTWAAKYTATPQADAANWKVFTDTWSQWRQARDSQLLPASDKGDLVAWSAANSSVAQPLVSKAADALDAIEAPRTRPPRPTRRRPPPSRRTRATSSSAGSCSG